MTQPPFQNPQQPGEDHNKYQVHNGNTQVGEHVTAYESGALAVQALINGKVDAVVIDNAPAQEFVAANEGLKILDTEFANEDYASGVAKGNTALLDAINGALAELEADGTLQSIVDQYITAE